MDINHWQNTKTVTLVDFQGVRDSMISEQEHQDLEHVLISSIKDNEL